MKISRLMATASLLSVACTISNPALAQDQGGSPTTDVGQEDAQTGSAAPIIVTGSRIARSETVSMVPIAVVGSDSIQQDAALNVQDLLQELPQFGVGTSRTNSNFLTSGNGTAP